MRISSIVSIIILFLLAGGACTFAAIKAADLVEERSLTEITNSLIANDHTWTSVHVDGLQVHLTGTAPDEATRFRALTVANKIVDAERVIDNMDVKAAKAIKAPEFSVEILRNSTGLSLIGLIPSATDRNAMIASIEKLDNGSQVTDMLDDADYPVPQGWDDALQFGLSALRILPKSKISISAKRVAITAISDSIQQKREFEAKLARKAPKDLVLVTNISAPRPVITPFTLRFIIKDETVRFDACSADTEKNRALIIKAALDAGFNGEAKCVIGLGVPSPSWGKAAAIGITALKKMGGGTITYSDADVTLVALDTTPQATFDRVIGELEADLPEVFSLHSVLPEPVKIDGTGQVQGPAEFIGTLSPEGQVQLRGRVADELSRNALYSYSRAKFGSNAIYGAARLDADLPAGWSLRVLAGVEALAELNQGSVVVQQNFVDVRGVTGNPDARANITRLLSEKLGASEDYNIEVTYEKKLDPVASLTKSQDCIGLINEVQQDRKISFDPGSSDLDANGLSVVTSIAEIIKTCEDMKLEISGHTDSQGSEAMNQSLSQARADAVLHALIAQRVLTKGMLAKGFGEVSPIATNETEEGREKNRRIEFNLIVPAKTAEKPSGLDQLEDATVKPDTEDNQAAEKPAEKPDEQN